MRALTEARPVELREARDAADMLISERFRSSLPAVLTVRSGYPHPCSDPPGAVAGPGQVVAAPGSAAGMAADRLDRGGVVDGGVRVVRERQAGIGWSVFWTQSLVFRYQ